VLKPIEDFSVLNHAVTSCLDKARLERENKEYQQQLERMVADRTVELVSSQCPTPANQRPVAADRGNDPVSGLLSDVRAVRSVAPGRVSGSTCWPPRQPVPGGTGWTASDPQPGSRSCLGLLPFSAGGGIGLGAGDSGGKPLLIGISRNMPI